ncbi:metallophosphoesterase [Jannaschia aquimarina]|uniref:PphB protein n=1 Tax=Jannaschia aquimarina TaxID=935700 RepID=A0A0D1EKR4_9RHOB|nr:metallophosphoesterase [Jannaschia aquimarina]KIT16310.1 Serine/threonine-protein phosphatase 2 [Jannaschia aquimarina]SNT26428.1 serine/threonine protein phosphatase 1 [Jannaschia aquimarina]
MRPVWVVGDVHGRLDLLEKALLGIEADLSAGSRSGDKGALVLLGDYVDRGGDSRGVLNLVRRLGRRYPHLDVVALMGNHERMLLDFIRVPEGDARRWLRHGGIRTLLSYGIVPVRADDSSDDLRRAARSLRKALSPDTVTWLEGLPTYWSSGNLVCVHAALDPALPMERQRPEAMLWGHPRFLAEPRQDDLWVAHGHTTVDEPVVEDRRIAVDTGAYETGRLTSAAISVDGDVRFMTVEL